MASYEPALLVRDARARYFAENDFDAILDRSLGELRREFGLDAAR